MIAYVNLYYYFQKTIINQPLGTVRKGETANEI